MWGTALRSRICWRYSRGSVRWIVLSRIRRGALHSCTSGGARMLERRERLFRVWSFLGLRWKSSLRDRFVLTFNCLLFVMWFIDFGYMLITLMWCGAFVWLVWWFGLSLFSGEVDGFLVGVRLRILSLLKIHWTTHLFCFGHLKLRMGLENWNVWKKKIYRRWERGVASGSSFKNCQCVNLSSSKKYFQSGMLDIFGYF